MIDIKSYNLKDLFNVENKIEEIKNEDQELLDQLENIDDWFIAGKIDAYLLEFGRSIIKEGESVLEIYEKITAKMEEIKALSDKEIMFAFPINISFDDCAAHYTPDIEDDLVFEKNIIKLDIGTSVNGAIGDSAITIDLSDENHILVEASKEALMNGISIINPEISLGEIGSEIERTILSKGLMPIRNLSGHKIERYNLHSGQNIPNYDTKEQEKVVYGSVYAVEPFATTGAGMIENKGAPDIFMKSGNKLPRSQIARAVLSLINQYKGLPFSKLNLFEKQADKSVGKINFGLRELKQMGVLAEYAPLIEIENGLVSQAEHTIIVGKRAFITTSLE